MNIRSDAHDSKVPVIDVHTHMMSREYIEVIRKHGGKYTIDTVVGGKEVIHRNGAPFTTLFDEMYDYDLRIKNMDKAGVDIAVVSLTCPSVYWGGEEVSVSTTRLMNDHMAAARNSHPKRIRYFATLPWQYPAAAIKALDEALANGASGVMVLASIEEEALIGEKYAPIWKKIDEHALPVLVHPTTPPGLDQMDMRAYNLVPPIGFMFDTTLCIAKMIFDGFFDTYPNLKIIASHGGATLPYLIGRMDRCHEMMPPARVKISEPPSTYLRRCYADAVVYSVGCLQLCIDAFGEENVMYGSDYPHNIGDMAGCLSRVNSLMPPQRDKVRGLNAQRIFNVNF